MIEPGRRSQDFCIRQRQDAEPLGVVEHLRRVDVENIRLVGGVNELEILRDEIDIDHAAGGMFQIPDVGLALLQRNRPAHFRDIVGDAAGSRGRVSTARMTFSIRARNSGDAEITRARVSAMCSHVQAS